MFEFSVKHNVAEVIDKINRFTREGRDATAYALTLTARDLHQSYPAKLETDLDNPTPFTKRGFYVKGANTSTLTAEVGVMPKQAEYLRYQVLGGSRSPRKVALRLPSEVDLNQYGNLPAGVIRQLVARAKAGKRTTKRLAGRTGVGQSNDLFYGDPGDGRPVGIYKRTGMGTKREKLVPVVVMPKRAATYRRRFDFFGHGRSLIVERWPVNVRRAFARAIERF